MEVKYPNKEFWRGKKVFVTGHTGFKGAWLCTLLNFIGARVYGYALRPHTVPSLYDACNMDNFVVSNYGDIRDKEKLLKSLINSEASIVIHMAAQPLVRRSFREPVYTFDTNMMGTVNILESIRNSDYIKSGVIVTTDKCYLNTEQGEPYKENNRLGGYDPYSASKAACELITQSYIQSYFNSSAKYVATARAGNVIGGGDWSEDRLIPDILRSIESKSDLNIRYPKAIRPWQHVLEPLTGYLLLAEELFNGNNDFTSAWNFGPEIDDARDVDWITNRLISQIPTDIKVVVDKNDNPHETSALRLDITKARQYLKWTPKWDVEKAIDSIVDFHSVYSEKGNILSCLKKQIEQYLND